MDIEESVFDILLVVIRAIATIYVTHIWIRRKNIGF